MTPEQEAQDIVGRWFVERGAGFDSLGKDIAEALRSARLAGFREGRDVAAAKSQEYRKASHNLTNSLRTQKERDFYVACAHGAADVEALIRALEPDEAGKGNRG